MQVPSSTYRLQFTPSFGFRKAGQIVSYLSKLGVSHIYASPIFQARAGSQHGYDVVDPNRFNPELGSQQQIDLLFRKIKKLRLGWIQDIVPNHMAYDSTNSWLMNVFEQGPSSSYYHFFDVEWNHPDRELQGRLLAPFLGHELDQILKNGEIRIQYERGGFFFRYFGLKFPIRLESYGEILAPAESQAKSEIPVEVPRALRSLKFSRQRAEWSKKRLWALSRSHASVRSFISRKVRALNSRRDLLRRHLSRQVFNLAFWNTASTKINYRRFFTINELISMRIERREVFDSLHRLIFKHCHNGNFDGLRIDHIDGLYDPYGYLIRLRKKLPQTYLVVEKILERSEKIREEWPIQGTTGYEFLNAVNGLFCDSRQAKLFQALHLRFAGQKKAVDRLVYENKYLMMKNYMSGDIDGLVFLLNSILRYEGKPLPFEAAVVRRTLMELLACFPIYRTYITQNAISPTDKAYIQAASDKAKKLGKVSEECLEFLKGILSLEKSNASEDPERSFLPFVMRFQQYTGPLMAKGFEDTTLYRHSRLVSLNEVGGQPESFGVSRAEWDDINRNRADHWPHSMNATATHDTKRGEDVRARINLLSELGKEWRDIVYEWNEMNRHHKTILDRGPIPDRNDEYILYQTLVGAYPITGDHNQLFVDRITNYLIKVCREAKVHSDWIRVDSKYETALRRFIHRILEKKQRNEFLKSFRPFAYKVSYYGIYNSLSQTLLKITAPGIPDFYQGTELWDLSLVDPDNRRPVDFRIREVFLRKLLAGKRKQSSDAFLSELWRKRRDGRIKMYLIHQGLTVRREFMTIFEKGEYVPLTVRGKHERHVVAFGRRHRSNWAITVAPRFLTNLVSVGELAVGRRVWGDTHIVLPGEKFGEFHDSLTPNIIATSRRLFIGDVLARFPVALLIRTEP